MSRLEEWCTQAGFKNDGDALDALRAEGAVRSYRIQSGKIRLFFVPR